ncbi:MAG: hypothetical protein ABSE90_08505 [Verrucomicrobiota bacterium]|jgi:hypothetical protein
MSDNAKSAVFLVFLFFCLPIAILLASDWLKRRHLARLPRDLKAALDSGDFRLPYRISFTSTNEDLIQAFEAEKTAVSGMRRGVRWLIIGMGWMWLFGAVAFFAGYLKDRQWWLPLIWLTLGVSILWSNVVRPFLRRRHIRETAPAAQDLTLEFTNGGIHIEAPGAGVFDRAWDELDGARNCDEGVLVYFIDGTVDWLPRRVFQNDATKNALHAFLLEQIVTDETEKE